MSTVSKEEIDREPTQLTLEIWHPDCWTLQTTAEVDAGMIAHSVHEYDGLINARLTAYADRHEDIDELVSAIDRSDLTAQVERVTNYFNPRLGTETAGNVTEELLVRYNPSNSIHDAFLSRGFIPEEEIRIRNGYEYWTVIITAARANIQSRLDEIRDVMDAKITVQGMKSPETEPTAPLTEGQLSERQREVFEFARDQGYYSWPRELSATELAEELDISKATVLEHLRKAESKLLDPNS
ncbi:MAG: helix-turn-helix domain-containing protein [archaeon]